MRERASIHSRRSTSSFSSGGGFPGSHAINAATQPEEQKRHSRLHRQHADLLVERTRTFVHQVGDWSRVRVRKNMMAFLSEYLVGANNLASCVCAQRNEKEVQEVATWPRLCVRLTTKTKWRSCLRT